MSNWSREHLVGAIGLAIFFGAGLVTILGAGPEPMGDWTVRFSEVRGLRKKDEVWMRGVPIGKVSSIELRPNELLARLEIYRDIEFHEDYRVTLKPLSIFGGNYVDLDLGSPGKPTVPDATVLQGLIQDFPTDAARKTFGVLGDDGRRIRRDVDTIRDAVASDASSAGLFSRRGTDNRVEALREAWSATRASASAVGEAFTSGPGSLAQLHKELGGDGLRKLRGQFEEARLAIAEGKGSLPLFRSSELRSEIEVAMDDFARIRGSIDRIRTAWTESGGSAWLFLNDESLRSEVAALKELFKKAQAHFQDHGGSVLKLAYDQELRTKFEEAGEIFNEFWNSKGTLLFYRTATASGLNAAGVGEGKPGPLGRAMGGE